MTPVTSSNVDSMHQKQPPAKIACSVAFFGASAGGVAATAAPASVKRAAVTRGSERRIGSLRFVNGSTRGS